jgi:hypothetical protein
VPEFGQALGDPPSFRLLIFPHEGEAKNLPMFRFRRSSVLGRPYPQATNHIFIEVANR